MDENINDEEKFSEDPEEQLKIENEILKLKLQAELGADFKGEDELSPDVENIFLKNVLELEHHFANASYKTIFQILGTPSVASEANLSNKEIKHALAEIEELMEQKGIVVDYGQEYDDRIKYKFITEELFYKESTLIDIPGMTTHFIYEEFHPNHSLDIKANAEKFFNHWEERSFDENSFELASQFTLDDGTCPSRKEVLQKLGWIFDAYVRFDNASFSINDISFRLDGEEGGFGLVLGNVTYDAVLENGEIKNFSGPFRLYMEYDDWWGINNFNWPGFNW
jgi:hypothetical protein